MGIREQNRAEVMDRILEAARTQIAERGGVGLSMRAVARQVGVASSAVYRYFPTREAVITAMVVESYGHLDEALSGGRGWTDCAHRLRDWARANPHEFQLIYGTPIPGYTAPPETIPVAEKVAVHFVHAGSGQAVEEFSTPELTAQMARLTPPEAASSATAAVITELAALVGFLTLEIGGHFVGTADPADHLFTALVTRQARTLGRS